MMGKTFERFWDEAQEVSAAQFARVVVSWEHEKGMPPPINLLGVPGTLLYWTWGFVRRRLSWYSNFEDEATEEPVQPLTKRMKVGVDLVRRIAFILMDPTDRAVLATQAKEAAELSRESQFDKKPLSLYPQSGPIDVYYGSLEEMRALREKVEDGLLGKFGQWDSTNDLVRHAISVLSERITDLEEKITSTHIKRRKSTGSALKRKSPSSRMILSGNTCSGRSDLQENLPELSA
eukprot:1078672-Prymnesium_polylepis.1